MCRLRGRRRHRHDHDHLHYYYYYYYYYCHERNYFNPEILRYNRESAKHNSTKPS